MIVEDSHLVPRVQSEDNVISKLKFTQIRANCELEKEREELKTRNAELLTRIAQIKEMNWNLQRRLKVEDGKEIIEQKIFDRLTDNLLEKLANMSTKHK